MSIAKKFISKFISGKSDSNIDFNDLRKLLLHFGFRERIKGSHHIFNKEGIDEKLIFNLVKSYQKHIRLNK
jgi:hypothetical protein